MDVRKIVKQQAGIEDILTGIGTVSQQRSTGIKSIKRINPSEIQGAIVVATIAEMEALVISELGDTKTTVVQEEGRGGIFTYDSNKISEDNQGTNFSGWIREYSDLVSAEWFGLKESALDNEVPINLALLYHDAVYIPAGIYSISNTIDITSNKTIALKSGCTIIKSCEQPAFHLYGQNISLYGDTLASCFIGSTVKSPSGVVCIGSLNMNTDITNTTYCVVDNLTIYGSELYGQTSGDPDSCLYLGGPELTSGNTNYLHKISNISVRDANYGFRLDGWSNACIFNNLFAQRIGNTESGHNAMLWLNGAVDNTFSGAFFHHSTDSYMIKLTDLDNSAIVGGNLHNVYANTISGFVSEQGGTNARVIWSDIITGSSYFQVKSNVYSETQVPVGWKDSNTLISSPLRLQYLDIEKNETNDKFLYLSNNITKVGSAVTADTWDPISSFQSGESARFGNMSICTLAGSGTLTFKIKHRYTLSGSYRQSGVELFYSGCESGGAATISSYILDIRGTDTWNMKIPIKIAGDDLIFNEVSSTSTETVIECVPSSTTVGALKVTSIGPDITYVEPQ